MKNVLPPGVTFRKERISGIQAYIFRHEELGELGRILIQGLPNGDTHISSEVSGDPDDPGTKIRQDIFIPISEKITSAMEAQLGKGSLGGASLPTRPKGSEEQVAIELTPCNKCGVEVALLIYAIHAAERADFEDWARKMHHKYTQHNVPTWIIGGPVGGKNAKSDAPCYIMKVWPDKGSIKTPTPEQFNAGIKELMRKHCDG